MAKREARKKREAALAPTLPRSPSIPQLPVKKQRRARRTSDSADDISIDSLGPCADRSASSGNEAGFATAREESNSSIATLSPSDGEPVRNIIVCVRIKPCHDDKDATWKLDPAQGRITLSDQHNLIKARGGKSSEDAYSFIFGPLALWRCAGLTFRCRRDHHPAADDARSLPIADWHRRPSGHGWFQRDHIRIR
jgi:hypothetical protein